MKSKIASDRLRGAALRQRAVELRCAGWSYQAIGDAIGCSRQNAFKHVSHAFDEIRAETSKDATELRLVEIERLDALLRAVWQPALEGDFAAVDRALKIAERRARLCGLDAPNKVAVADHDGKPMFTDLARRALAADLADDDVRALAEIAGRAGESS